MHQLGTYLYRYHNNLLPPVHHTISFPTVADTHSYTYDTRQSSTIQIAPTKTILAKNTIKIQGAIFWNILRPAIKNSPSLYTFKNNLKHHIIDQYDSNESNNDYASIT